MRPLEFLGQMYRTTIVTVGARGVNALSVVYWLPQCIAIDHSWIGLKRLTIPAVFSEAMDHSWIGLKRLTTHPVFNEARLCVWTRILCHNTSLVCTATQTHFSIQFWVLQSYYWWLFFLKYNCAIKKSTILTLAVTLLENMGICSRFFSEWNPLSERLLWFLWMEC